MRLWRCALFVGLMLLPGAMAHAACASPSAPEGSLKYDTATHKFRYCDDSDTWQPLGGDVAAVNGFTQAAKHLRQTRRGRADILCS